MAPDDLSFLRADAAVDDQKNGLAWLWREVYGCLGTEDRNSLGAIHIGRTGDEPGATAWAQTNADEERVNLTLELKPSQLELNIVGWKEEQSDRLKDWLQSVRGEIAVNALQGYEVVAFARRAYKKTPQSKPWWQDEKIEELGRCAARDFNASWVSRAIIGLGSRKEVKPAFHIRRSWCRTRPYEREALVAEVAAEVERLLPLLQKMWTSAAERW